MLNGTETSSIKGEGNEACPRCQGKVFEAEKMKTKTHVWHKKCFTCCKVCKMIIIAVLTSIMSNISVWSQPELQHHV